MMCPEDETTRVLFAASRSRVLTRTNVTPVKKEPGGRLASSQLLSWLVFWCALRGEKKKESERKPARRWQHASSGSWCRVCFHWLLRDVDLKSLILKIVHCYSVWIIQNLVKITNNHADTTHLRTSQGSPQPIIDLFLAQRAAASPRTCPLLSAAVNPVEALPPGSLPGRSV